MKKRDKPKITITGDQKYDGIIPLLMILFIVLVLWLVVALNSAKFNGLWDKSLITGNSIKSSVLTVNGPSQCEMGKSCGQFSLTGISGATLPYKIHYYWTLATKNNSQVTKFADSANGVPDFQTMSVAYNPAVDFVNPNFKYVQPLGSVSLWVRLEKDGINSSWSALKSITIANSFWNNSIPTTCYYGVECPIMMNAPVATPFWYELYFKAGYLNGTSAKKYITGFSPTSDWIKAETNSQRILPYIPSANLKNGTLWIRTYKSGVYSDYTPAYFITFENVSAQAPACVESNWNFVLTPETCPVSGKQNKNWSKNSNCLNGFPQPASSIINCNYQSPLSSCTGTAPIAAAGKVIGPNSTSASPAEDGPGSEDPTIWEYSSSASTSTACKWGCASGYFRNGTNCQANVVVTCNSDLGCSNAPITHAHNISGTCTTAGYTCYACDSNYIWDEMSEECIYSETGVIILDSELLFDGITRSVAVNNTINMIVNDLDHSVKIDLINATTVKLTVSSTPQTAMLKLNEEKKFDVDGDAVNDLSIKVNKITTTPTISADLVFTALENVVPDDTNTNTDTGTDTDTNTDTDTDTDTNTDTGTDTDTDTNTDTGTDTDNDTTTDTGGSSLFSVVLVIMIIAVIIAIVFVYLKKSGKLDKMMNKKSSGGPTGNSQMMPRPPFPPMNPMMNGQPRPMMPPQRLPLPPQQRPVIPAGMPPRPFPPQQPMQRPGFPPQQPRPFPPR